MPPLPLSSFPSPPGQPAQTGWTVDQCFTAYGLRFGLRSNSPLGLELVASRQPLGWQPAPPGPVDIQYSLWTDSQSGNHRLYCGAIELVNGPELPPLLTGFAQHAELLTAYCAADNLFIHAGVVGWQGQAIVIPGRSFTGKTTLVQALVQAGATYYSDEFAVLDKVGRVLPYARPLSIRSKDGRQTRQTPVTELGGQAGAEPLPVALVVITAYRPKAEWQPRRLTAGQTMLALMDNAIAAQGNPAHSMPILKQVASRAIALQSDRGDAEATAPALLAEITH